MPTPQPPSQQQADEAQQARYAAEVAILALFTATEAGGGEGEDEVSGLHTIEISAVLAALSAAIVFASFRSPRDRAQSLLSEKPDHELVSQAVLPEAQREFKELAGSELEDEQKAVLWATGTYSRVADELARAINEGEIPHEGVDQGLTLQKIWIARSDGRTRPLHAKLHGRTVPTSDDFWRWPHSGERLRWPGDREAPEEATIGCRCVVLLSWSENSEVSKTIRSIIDSSRSSSRAL